MIEISSITGAYASLKLAKETAEAMIGIRDFNEFAPKMAALNDQLFKTQKELFGAMATLTELQHDLLSTKAELTELKNCANERERYALVDLGRGVITYRLKQLDQRNQGVGGAGEPIHYLCQPCLDNRSHRVVLQPYGYGDIGLICSECKNIIWQKDTSGMNHRALTDGDRY